MQTYWKVADQKFLKITQIQVLVLSYTHLVLRRAEVWALPSCSIGVHRNIKP